MIIAQISDPHITDEEGDGKCEDRAAYLRRAAAHLLWLPAPPDVVLVTGDCVNNGRLSEYRYFRELIRPLIMPVYLVPGNHDDRVAMQQMFGAQGTHALEGFVQYVMDTWPVRVLCGHSIQLFIEPYNCHIDTAHVVKIRDQPVWVYGYTGMQRRKSVWMPHGASIRLDAAIHAGTGCQRRAASSHAAPHGAGAAAPAAPLESPGARLAPVVALIAWYASRCSPGDAGTAAC